MIIENFYTMCLAIPAKIIKITKTKANVKQMSVAKEINISILPGLKLGDYVIIQGGMAVQKIPKKEAEEIIKLVKEGQNDK